MSRKTTKRTALMSVTEEASDIQLLTDVNIISEVTTVDGEKFTFNRWRCTSTGAIGRGASSDEARTWIFLAENDQRGSVSFGISDEEESSQDSQFSIDVSGAVQEGKITLWSEFPFYLNMEGTGIIKGLGGVIAKGTKINYKVVNIF